MRTLATTVAVLALTASAASANWTGCKVGAHVGVMASATEVDASSAALPGASLVVDGMSTQGANGGGLVGCDMQIGTFVLGAFADYTFQDNEWKTSITVPGGGASVSASIEDQWSIGGRVGHLITPTTLLYGLVAYTEAKTSDLTVTATNIAPLSWSIDDVSGYQLGGGFESIVLPNVTLSLEYRFTRFDAANVQIAQLPANLDLETDSHAVRFSVAYRFGLSEPLMPTK